MYSIQKINLKSSKLIFLLINLYSGNCLYFSNNSVQSLLIKGGNIPENKLDEVLISKLSKSSGAIFIVSFVLKYCTLLTGLSLI